MALFMILLGMAFFIILPGLALFMILFDMALFMNVNCQDHKGAIRMKGLERTLDGRSVYLNYFFIIVTTVITILFIIANIMIIVKKRCKIGSQFMIWVGDLEYKEYRYTLVFGRVRWSQLGKTQHMIYFGQLLIIGSYWWYYLWQWS